MSNSNNKYTSDIYQISSTVDELQRQYMPDISDRTRTISIMGYMNDIHSTQIQNAIITASEMANEMWTTRAKFEKNIIAHSIIQNITDINAIPARMEIYIGFECDELEKLLTNDQFIIDKYSSFYIGNYEYHLPYDLVITRNIVLNNEKVFTAKYIFDKENELAKDLTNPYLPSPFITRQNTQNFIMIKCMIMQVHYETISKKILSSSVIENKTLEFDFENQLASFSVKVTEPDGKEVYLTPIFEGLGLDEDKEFCYYIYEDIDNIRVRFDSISYLPSLNANVEIEIKTTNGEEANFEYNTSFFQPISSTKYGYNNLSLFVLPQSDSKSGRNRKSIEELKRLLPKEALSRGSISNLKDLTNYFQMLDTDFARMSFMKKIDNQFERTYYSYLVLKDNLSNIVPTNTLNLLVSKNNGFDQVDNRKRILKTGCAIGYSRDKNEAFILKREDAEEYLKSDPNNHFVYTTPFTLVVNDDPLYISYLLTIFNMQKLLIFSYINESCPIQFISTAINWTRKYSIDPDIYTLRIPLTQNINTDCGIIDFDENGIVTKTNIKSVLVLYNEDNEPYRYLYGDLLNYTTKGFMYDFEFKIKTDDKINDDGKIKVYDLYIPSTTIQDYGYLSDIVGAKIYILARMDSGKKYGRYDLDNIIPEGLEEYTVTNMYDIEGGLNTYINFTDIVRSTTVSKKIDNRFDIEEYFLIDSVPLIKRSYMDNEHNIQQIVDLFIDRKEYLDNGIYLLENNFNIDFKLFNTYGPSRMYSLEEGIEKYIDRINITINFEIKLVRSSDVYTKEYILKDIKDMIEDLNDMTHLHIPNLITEISNKYVPYSIEYIEFLGFNDYGPGEQHLYRIEKENESKVPEFICCDIGDDNISPAINIYVV